MAEHPYSGEGTTAENGGYQILTAITQNSSSTDSDYDYPSDPTRVLIQQAVTATTGNEDRLEIAAATNHSPAFGEMSQEAKRVSLGGLDAVPDLLFRNAGGVEDAQDSLSSSEGESSGPDAAVAEPNLIRQIIPSPKSHRTGMDSKASKKVEVDGGDDKLFLTGNLANCSNIRAGLPSNDTSSPVNNEFADEGIYQGLVMTDKQKRNLGILPESLYMTTNLLEKGALIESMSLSIPAVAVEVPEVPLPPNSPSIFTKDTLVVADTIPRAPPPKPPRREKGWSRLQGSVCAYIC